MEAHSDNTGKLVEILEIVTTSFIYKIPITAMIVTKEEFEQLDMDIIKTTQKRLPVNAKPYVKTVPKKELVIKHKNPLEHIDLKIFDASDLKKYLVEDRESGQNSMDDDDN